MPLTIPINRYHSSCGNRFKMNSESGGQSLCFVTLREVWLKACEISQVMLDKRHPKRSLQKNRNHSGLVGTSAPGFRLPVFESRQKVLFHPVVLSFHLLQNCQPPGFVQGAAQCGQSNLRTKS